MKICKYKKKIVPLQRILGMGYWVWGIGYGYGIWDMGYGVWDMGYGYCVNEYKL